MLTDNGTEFCAQFDELCDRNNIKHERTSPSWPQCNGMAERFVQTLKIGLTTMASQWGDEWDNHVARILYGYRFSSQGSTKFSPFFVLTGRTPRLSSDNVREKFQEVIHEEATVEEISAVMLERTQLLEDIHKAVIVNIATAQRKQQENYISRKGKIERFPRLDMGCAVKMFIPGKRRALSTNWEGPYVFKGHARVSDNVDDEACRLCQVVDAQGKLWERARRDIRCFEGELLGGRDAPT